MQDRAKIVRFEQMVLPHLGNAYNLARWLIRNDQDAEDVVQEACLRNLTRQGYNSVQWSRSGMAHWAVSDLNQKELREFVELIQTHASIVPAQ